MSIEDTFWSDHYPLLGQINSPEDLKKMPASEMPALAEEIREFLVDQVSETGGHLASNLGAVELTLAIHRVFSTPQDHLIFDVGHQSYIHKLLTGRKERFPTLRQSGGLSGFPKRCESEHDCFGTGHSSTSISAALGFAEADRMAGSQAYTVCVVGDGAYTGGMIHEALNNCRKRLNLIIILNENEMSISKNIGRFARNLSHIRASNGYIWTKNAIGRFVSHIPLIGKWLYGRLLRFKMGMKAALYGSNLFESLGLYYLGPVDGNNEAAVEKLLRDAKKTHQSCVIHLKTRKGKGYAPAEATPDRFHGMSPADAPKPECAKFSDAMGEELCRMAAKNDRICAITAAMTDGTGPKFDVVVMDVRMPGMDGLETLGEMKKIAPKLPVILLTALNNEKDILSGLQIGADEYVVKPFNIGILKANVANLLANRALLRSKFANLDLNDEENDEDCINCSQDIDWKFIANVKKNVEDNIDNPALTVDVLCSLMGMSRTSFYNKLRALTDQAPGDYIRLIRLKRAVQLLKEDTHSITEIAEMTGFSDAKYFREVFKKHYNVSPSQYGKEKKAVSKEGGEKKE